MPLLILLTALVPVLPPLPAALLAAGVLLCVPVALARTRHAGLALVVQGALPMLVTCGGALGMTSLTTGERFLLGVWPLVLHTLLGLPLAALVRRAGSRPRHWAAGMILLDVLAGQEGLWRSGADAASLALALPLNPVVWCGPLTGAALLLLLGALLAQRRWRPAALLGTVTLLTVLVPWPAGGGETRRVQVVQGGEVWSAGQPPVTPEVAGRRTRHLAAWIPRTPATVTLLPEQAVLQPHLRGVPLDPPLPFPRGTIYGAIETTSLDRFNAAFLVGETRALRRKVLLVPLQESRELRAGRGDQADPVLLPGGVRASLRICLEALYPHNLRQARQRGAQLLLVPTNTTDATAFRWQATAVRAAARAVALPVLISNERGHSLIQDVDGRVLRAAGWGRPQALTATVQLAGPLTPFVLWGEWPLLLCGGALLLRSAKPSRPAA